MTIQDALALGVSALKADGLEDHYLETEILLTHTLKCARSYILAHPEKKLTARQAKLFKNYIARRLKREPVAYITNIAHFMSLEFYVDKNVLIPRPETELLVETVMDLVGDEPQRYAGFDNKSDTGVARRFILRQILDIGTGSGAIAISIAKNIPNAQITATDISAPAIKIANKNAKAHNVTIEFIKGDLFKPVNNRIFDLIISNPPYVSLSEYKKTSPQVKYEPQKALLAGKDGLDVIRKILKEAPQYLKPNGTLMFEIGAYQGKAVKELAKQTSFENVIVSKDYQGLDRIFIGRLYTRE